MSNQKNLVIAAAAFATFTAGAVEADIQGDVQTNIYLFDELMSCSISASFDTEGFDFASPCRQWFLDASDQRDVEGDILAAGYDCTADEILMAGHLLWVGDVESFNLVRDKVQLCQDQLAAN